MVRSVVTLALLAALAACGPAQTPPASAPPPGPPLPRLWTLGPAAADLPGPKIEITLEGDGRIRVDGREVDGEGLDAALLALAESRRDLDHPNEPGEGLVVIHCHRELPWRSVQRVLMRAAKPAVRLYRFVFAVEPDGGGAEGTFAHFLSPDWHTGIHHQKDTGERGHRIEIKTGKPDPCPPSAVVAPLRELPAGTDGVGFQVNAWARVPVEYVLQVLDLLGRAGVREIWTVGPPPTVLSKPPPTIEATRGIRPSMLFDRAGVAGAGEPPREVRRSRTLVGQAEAPVPRSYWYFAEPPEPDPVFGPRLREIFGRLAELQGRDGSWDLGHAGATGLALLAFVENGVTHKRTEWKGNVRRGINFLRRAQKDDGRFPGTGADHAFATSAFAALYRATASPIVKLRAKRALEWAEESEPVGPVRAWTTRARAVWEDRAKPGDLLPLLETELLPDAAPEPVRLAREALRIAAAPPGDERGPARPR